MEGATCGSQLRHDGNGWAPDSSGAVLRWRVGFSVDPLSCSLTIRTAGYLNQVTEAEGELVGLVWRNPHIRLALKTINTDGEEEIRTMHGNSIYNMQREGVTRDLFRIGERVRVAGPAIEQGRTRLSRHQHFVCRWA